MDGNICELINYSTINDMLKLLNHTYRLKVDD